MPNTRKRSIKSEEYRSFRLQKRIRHHGPKLPNSFRLFWRAITTLWHGKKLFGGIVVIYFLLSMLFVRGLGSTTNLGTTKELLTNLADGFSGALIVGVTLTGTLLGSVGRSSSEVASAYQSSLLVVVSLALIWALRHYMAGKKVTIRDSFYKGMTPLIPFLLVLLFMSLQMIPVLLAGQLYDWGFVQANAVTLPEQVIWAFLCFLLVLWSVYMLAASVFALYIVMLPNMRPLQALRAAKKLVQYRRWAVMRRVVFLPIALLLIGGITIFPIALWLTPAAGIVFYFMTMLGLAVAHSYMYQLYRELLKA